MLRSWSIVGLLLVCVLQVGCGRCGPRFGCEGCGPKYWGAYVDDPPRCEPCDCFGNWIGCGSCGSCCTEPACGEPACGEPACGEPSCGVDGCCSSVGGCGSKYPWIRSQNRRASFWQMLSACNNRKNAECCTGGCGAGPRCCEPSCAVACEPTCAEPTCAQPSCGEPGCGYAPSCGCGESHTLMSSRSPVRRSVPMQTVGHSTTVDYRMSSPSGCNCGKH